MGPNPTATSAFEGALQAACARLGYSGAVYRLLASATREIRIEIPILLDNDELAVFTGYRVQHQNALGPYKGGLRYHPSVDIGEVRELASLMTLKTSLMNLPLGGGKGGIECNPRELSLRELERLTRKFVQLMGHNIGPETDIMAPDVGTNAQVMGWIYGEYGAINGPHFGVVTGKPLTLGGSPGRDKATGYGVALTLAAYADFHGINLQGARIAVQGFGNVGHHAALCLRDLGLKIVAVSDSHSTIYCPDGIDLDAVVTQKRNHSRFAFLPGHELLEADAVLGLPCDYLVPAALGGALHKDNVSKVQASVVVEAANAPCTLEAEADLNARGIIIIPDILANAGGVVVSYFEWVQNLQSMRWSGAKVDNELETIQRHAAMKVFEEARSRAITLRDASYDIAVRRVKEAIDAAGF
ncbi:MAG: Glu/Leu/Phe/Val dehydrogenase [Parvibaculum sp.]